MPVDNMWHCYQQPLRILKPHFRPWEWSVFFFMLVLYYIHICAVSGWAIPFLRSLAVTWAITCFASLWPEGATWLGVWSRNRVSKRAACFLPQVVVAVSPQGNSILSFFSECVHSLTPAQQPNDLYPHQPSSHPGHLFQHPIIADFINHIWNKHARGFGEVPEGCSRLYTEHDPCVPQQTVALAMTVVCLKHFKIASYIVC